MAFFLQTYRDLQTGNDVLAGQVEHAGIQLSSMQKFEVDDWLIKYPLDLLGNGKEEFFTEKAFPKRFTTLQPKKTLYWTDLKP